MLTWDDLEGLRVAGKLDTWKIGTHTLPGGRVLYMLPEVMQDLKLNPWPASQGEIARHTSERRVAMRQVLERFVKGHNLNINRDMKELGSRKLDEAFRGYWEFRSQGRMEETRLFGFFARKGAFVATALKARGAFGGVQDPAWATQRENCRSAWDNLTSSKAFLAEPWPVRVRADLSAYLDQ